MALPLSMASCSRIDLEPREPVGLSFVAMGCHIGWLDFLGCLTVRLDSLEVKAKS